MELKIVSFRGQMGSGKTTAAEYLVSQGYKRISFADPLREAVRKITPDGQIIKVRDRELMQWLGTNYFREMNSLYYVIKWIEALVECKELTSGPVCRVVVDDARFPNEFETINSRGGLTIWLSGDADLRQKRLIARDGGLGSGIQGHESESHVPADAYDYPKGAVVVRNDFGIEQFHKDIDRVIREGSIR